MALNGRGRSDLDYGDYLVTYVWYYIVRTRTSTTIIPTVRTYATSSACVGMDVWTDDIQTLAWTIGFWTRHFFLFSFRTLLCTELFRP